MNNNFVDKLISKMTQQRIKNILHVIETGTIQGNYSSITIYNDGKPDSSGQRTYQLTYGASQTTEQGNLAELIQMYVDAHGKYTPDFKPYLTKIGIVPLYQDHVFISALKAAGGDPVMMQVQDAFFDKDYFQPACKWFEAEGFTLALSLLVIYDSFIQSGSIMQKLRDRFTAAPPANKGDEKIWISSYLKVRHDFLANNPQKETAESVYRVICYQKQVELNNWNLSAPVKIQDFIV